MKNLVRLVSIFVLVALAVPAFATTPAPIEAQDDTFTLAWIPKALNNPVFELGRDGCMQAAAELSEMTGKTVECLYMGSDSSDMAEQARVIEDAISMVVRPRSPGRRPRGLQRRRELFGEQWLVLRSPHGSGERRGDATCRCNVF